MRIIKLNLAIICCLFFSSVSVNAQDWMSNLQIAQKLALVQNKMVLMVWEEDAKNDYPVLVFNNNNNPVLIKDLFSNEELNKLIWDNFVPVSVPEVMYDDMYEEIKNKRSQFYLDKFNDNSLKVMDVNGHIINVNMTIEDSFNLTKLIQDYSFNTKFLSHELRSYADSKTFLTSYFLASKYIDFSMYNKKSVTKDILDVAKIYLKNAAELLINEPADKQPELKQRLELLELEPFLLQGRSGKVLRVLKRNEKMGIFDNNQAFAAFLYYTAHKIRNEQEKAEPWKSKISSINLKKAEGIININRR